MKRNEKLLLDIPNPRNWYLDRKEYSFDAMPWNSIETS
jgi:hypothetical protein